MRFPLHLVFLPSFFWWRRIRGILIFVVSAVSVVRGEMFVRSPGDLEALSLDEVLSTEVDVLRLAPRVDLAKRRLVSPLFAGVSCEAEATSIHDPLPIDATAFLKSQAGLRTVEPTLPPGFSFTVKNERKGSSDGTKVALTFQLSPWWQMSGSYGFYYQSLCFNPASRDAAYGPLEGNSPIISLGSTHR